MFKFSKKFKAQSGFTLAELLIAVIISLLILLIVVSGFLLNQRVIRKNNTKSELTQNARIALDLMSRELRQATEIVTTLPMDDSDPSEIAHEIQFEDGHTTTHIQYIKYYLDGDNLKRQIIIYYFDSEPSAYVRWDDLDAFGPPEELVLEDRIIGENFSNINYYGESDISIELLLNKREENIEMMSIINPRNI